MDLFILHRTHLMYGYIGNEDIFTAYHPIVTITIDNLFDWSTIDEIEEPIDEIHCVYIVQDNINTTNTTTIHEYQMEYNPHTFKETVTLLSV